MDLDKYFVLEHYKTLNPDLMFSTDEEYRHHWDTIGKEEMRLFHKDLIDIECEFSHEMTFFIPYFSYLYKNNLFHQSLTVLTFEGMQPFYCFLTNKINILFSKTHKRNTNLSSLFILDNIVRFQKSTKCEFWDFKTHYANDIFKFEKEPLLIINKYAQNNTEINLYFSPDVLTTLFETFRDKYTIIYHQSPPFTQIDGYSYDGGEVSTNENSDSIFFSRDNLYKLKNTYGIILFSDLLEQYNMPYNELQLKLFSSCDNYICHPGGLAEIIALYFARIICHWHQGYTNSAVENGMYKQKSVAYLWYGSSTNDLHDPVRMKSLCNSIF